MFPNTTLEQLGSGNVSANITETAEISDDQECFLSEDTQTEVILKATAYFLILLVSLSGNILILIITYKNKKLRKTVNYFVFNMAVSDLCIPLTITLIRIVNIVSGSDSWKVESPRLLGNILCKLSHFLPDVSLIVSIESLLLISLDRLISALSPLNTTFESAKTRVIGILSTWIIAFVVYSPYFYTFRLFSDEDRGILCISDWEPAFDRQKTHKIYTTTTHIAFVITPICLLIIVYGTIAWVLKKRNDRNRKQLSYQLRHLEQQRRKIIRMTAALVICFVTCMIPTVVYMFTRIFLWDWDVPPICAFETVLKFIAGFMVLSWSALNPCTCLIFMRIYRKSFGKLLPVLN
ncbi:neuropeptide FF receptor 2-like [Stylophora pistillata]|uniref:neuropeptide FF receptor 2-like n=1 Tax=Stylophora pistillata TaxID=50429 RepID=UPI000C05267A|nr:neuropeptide FF receptor 2-like [Stylophora pistillata]